MAHMGRAGVSRARLVGVALFIVLLVVGLGYFLQSPAGKGTSLTNTGTGAESSMTATTLSSSTPPTSPSTSSSSSLSGSSSGVSSTASSSSSVSTPQSTSTSASPTSSTAPPTISHVVIILMENEEYGSVIGNSSAPYQNSLASHYALAGNYLAVAHPSLPNYLALVGGSTFGVSSDCLPWQCSLPSSTTTIATLLDSRHLSWDEFAESMPANCSELDGGQYYARHNPFVYFGDITGNNGTGSTSAYCDSHVVALTQFYDDLQAGSLPNYSFVTPNICDDAHSCPLSTGDQWLAGFVPKIIGSSSFSSTAIFIVYDEGASNDLSGGGGQVACLLVSPFAKSGYVSLVQYTHYSLLATVEAIFHLGNLGRNDSGASPMSDLFANGLP